MSSCRGWGAGTGLAAGGYEVSLQDDSNILKLDGSVHNDTL